MALETAILSPQAHYILPFLPTTRCIASSIELLCVYKTVMKYCTVQFWKLEPTPDRRMGSEGRSKYYTV
jgi:hypothetical protein